MLKSTWSLPRLAVPLLLYAAAQACSSDGGTEPPPPPAPVPTSVQLSQASVSLASLGATAQLTASVKDQNGNTISGAAVSWSSNNEEVARVNSSGTVTAVGVGATQITATSGSAIGTASVTVTQVPAEVAAVGGDAQTATVGQVVPMALTVQVNDGGGSPIPDVSVSFAATQGGGSVADATVDTDPTGQASTTWTLGPTAGQQLVTATVEGEVNGIFTATATADVADSILISSGDGQQGPTDTKLDDPIVVKVVDQFGNGVEGHDVSFAVTGGGGVLDSESETTDADGEAGTGWTLGSLEGTNTATGSAPGLKGDPVTFTAIASNLAVSGVSPDPIVEGETATISGNGFSPIVGNNAVTVDGVAATVTSALPTALEIEVPTFDCRPARMVDVQVTVSGATEGISHEVNPAAFVSVAAGEQMIISNPADFCLQFDAAAGDERFLVGVTAVSEVATSRTEVTLTSVTPSGSTAPPRVAMRLPAGPRALRVGSEQLRRIEARRRHRTIEARLLAEQLRELSGLPRALASGAFSAVPSDVQVGDTIPIRVPKNCSAFTAITTVAEVVGTRGVWLRDIANDSTEDFSATQYQSFSDQLDQLIYTTNVQYLGEPTDLDNNTRIVVVITKEVNKTPNLLGFVQPADLVPRTQCPSSDEGEVYYSIAPTAMSTAATLESLMGPLISHEFSHIVQVGRRFAVNAPVLQTVWELEGQATFMETQMGIVAQGVTPMDIDGSHVYDLPDSASSDWYSDMFTDIARYFGLDFTVSPPGRLGEAPWDCTWQDREVLDDECTIDGREVYGVPGSFLWWLSDQFGPTYTGGVGGVEGMQQAFIDNANLSGFANIATTIGVPIDSLLVQWQAAFYMDNRLVSGAPVPTTPRLTFTTWDFLRIFDGISFGGTNAGMTPKMIGFADASQSINVRGGSSGYFLLRGMGRSPTAIRVRDGADGPLPSIMRMWIARLK